MGPRRVGKTVLLYHLIQRLLGKGTPPRTIGYVSVDHPLYTGLTLESILALVSEASGHDFDTKPCFLFLDEIQYLPNWEAHLKSLVDRHPRARFIASGSGRHSSGPRAVY